MENQEIEAMIGCNVTSWLRGPPGLARQHALLLCLVHLLPYELSYNSGGNKHHTHNRDDYYALVGHRRN